MSARISALVAVSLLSTATAALAQVPPEDLAQPPADAEQFVIISAAGQHGTAARWTDEDGDQWSRESILLRGLVWEQDQEISFGADGMPARVTVRGTSPSGDSAETYEIADGTAKWTSQVDEGSAAYDDPAYYLTQGGTWISSADLVEALYDASGKSLDLLPSGTARLEKLTEAKVGEGDTEQTVTAYTIEGLSMAPQPIWVDADGDFFAFTQGMAIIQPEYQDAFQQLQAAQNEALAERAPAMVQRFGKVADMPVAFTGVTLFDSLEGRFAPGQTVVADAGKIIAVGDAASVAVPGNAKVIDGAGKTLVPGLWDAHMHVGSDEQGAMLYAIGVTSARNPGADVASTVQRMERIEAGELLFPEVFSSVLIDGKGPLAAQGGVSVSSAEEAVEGVRMAKEKGFDAVKFYTSMQPDWLRAGIAEAKRLGLHVHGHVPATMRASEAVAAGYDEITHINFVLMQALPDEVVDQANGIMRFQGPGMYGKDVDLDAEPIAGLIDTLAEEQIIIDPTLAVWESSYVPEPGDLSAAYAPFLGTMPPQTERQFRSGGDAPPEGYTREDYRASFAKEVELVGKLHEAGVPIVAGTDGSGLELIRELELYVNAGMTPAEALQTATIAPARLVEAADRTGSITVGKEADLVLVGGDVSADVGNLRHTEWVMSDGKLMNADELREAVGFTGPPR